MEPKTVKIKRIVDDVTGGTDKTFVEPTLEPREYYIYTECWTITTEQLDKIREKIDITAITVDGGSIMLTAKYNKEL